MKPVYITYKRKRLSLNQWSKITGISRCVLSWRKRKGWKTKDIFKTTKRSSDQIRKSNKNSVKKALKQRWKNHKSKHPSKKNWSVYIKSRNLLRDFGITLEHYNKLLKQQKQKCAICRKPPASKNKSLGVDHCHKTGKIRGLLCDKCNRGLGLFDDNIKLLEKAKKYLK